MGRTRRRRPRPSNRTGLAERLTKRRRDLAEINEAIQHALRPGPNGAAQWRYVQRLYQQQDRVAAEIEHLKEELHREHQPA